MKIFANYPDINIINTAIIPMIIAIFALGFPLLIQTISRIDDKYKSTKLIETFRKDWMCKCFLYVLVVTIASYVILMLQLQPLVNWGWLIDNSALILVTITTITLVVMTFLIVYLTYIYYVPQLLLNRLIKSYNRSSKQETKTRYFEAISKIMFYSINEADETLSRTLLEFYISAFIEFRKGKEGQTVEYPQEFYDTVFEANELLCSRKRKTVSYYNDSTLFELFLDSYQKTVISQKTYNFLWRLILQSLLYDKQDFVVSYWQKAHQLCNYFMKSVNPNIKYDQSTNKFHTENQNEVNKREKERKNFLEFHYALGCLLMYKQEYETLKELMNFTQSQPPSYVLVPEKMQQVIEWYMQINGVWNDFNFFYYVQKYQFPNNDSIGVNANDRIKLWIKRYLAILFIRQYTIKDTLSYCDTLKMPKIPENLSELRRWKDELKELESFVNEYLSQTDILNSLGFSQFTNPNWFDENKKTKPQTLIDNYIKEIEVKFNETKTKQNVDGNKKQQFNDATLNCLKPIFDKYKKTFSNESISNYKSYIINGNHSVLPKTAFSDNQDMGYSGFDSIDAQNVKANFQYSVLYSFVLMKPDKYYLTEKDLFLAIDKLNINSENFVIISIDLNLDQYSYLKIEGLEKREEKWYSKNIEIIELNESINNLLWDSIFIIKKEDLPNVIFNESTNENIIKYSLNKIDEEFNIYTNILDLNQNENERIRKETEKENNSKDLSQSVLVCVDINVETQYKQDVKCVQLKVFSQFDDRGKVNTIEDVQQKW